MKAALLYGPRDMRVESIDTPVVRDDEILVRVRACGICGTDVHSYKLGEDTSHRRPALLGHEFAGEVVEAGRLATGFNRGDRVAGTGYRTCGQCWWCREGRPERCASPLVPGEGLDGAFAEYVRVPDPVMGTTVFRLPEAMSWAEAATIEPLSVACYDVRRSEIRPTEVVVVMGAGMIGLCIVQVCKARGPCQVIVSEPNQFRRTVALQLGADRVADPSQLDLVQFVRQHTGGDMAGVVFDCAGSPPVLAQAIALLRRGGRLMQVATCEHSLELTPEMMYRAFQLGNIRWQGCGGQRWGEAVDLLSKGQVRTAGLVTHRFNLDQIREAFETQITAADAIKVMVEP